MIFDHHCWLPARRNDNLSLGIDQIILYNSPVYIHPAFHVHRLLKLKRVKEMAPTFIDINTPLRLLNSHVAYNMIFSICFSL